MTSLISYIKPLCFAFGLTRFATFSIFDWRAFQAPLLKTTFSSFLHSVLTTQNVCPRNRNGILRQAYLLPLTTVMSAYFKIRSNTFACRSHHKVPAPKQRLMPPPIFSTRIGSQGEQFPSFVGVPFFPSTVAISFFSSIFFRCICGVSALTQQHTVSKLLIRFKQVVSGSVEGAS